MTTIGTPLSPSATRVLLLGAGELGKEVIIALQRLGVETIAADRYDHAPGQQVAHHARTLVMSDPAQLEALIEAERPQLVVPASADWRPRRWACRPAPTGSAIRWPNCRRPSTRASATRASSSR